MAPRPKSGEPQGTLAGHHSEPGVDRRAYIRLRVSAVEEPQGKVVYSSLPVIPVQAGTPQMHVERGERNGNTSVKSVAMRLPLRICRSRDQVSIER